MIGVCGKLNVHDKKLWEVLEKKFIEEKIYRYVPLENIVETTLELQDSE